VLEAFEVARSGFPSPFRSPIATEIAPFPVTYYFGGANDGAEAAASEATPNARAAPPDATSRTLR